MVLCVILVTDILKMVNQWVLFFFFCISSNMLIHISFLLKSLFNKLQTAKAIQFQLLRCALLCSFHEGVIQERVTVVRKDLH